MAFVPQEEDKQNQQGQGQTPAMPVPTSSAPGAGPGMGPATSATGATASNQASPQPFTNLQAYLTANAPQISQMGTNIANQIGQNYGQVQNDIQSGATGFQNAVKSGYAAPNEELIGQAASNPADFVKNPTNVSDFQKQMNNQYTGPSNFEGSDYYANMNREVQDAASKANLVNTPEGINQYLMGLEQNPTKGDTTLDQVLLNTDPNVSKQIKAAAQPSLGLPDYLSGLVPQQNQAVQDAVAQSQASSQQARDALNNTTQGFESGLQNRLQSTQAGYERYNQQLADLQNALGRSPTSDLVNQSTWASLGVDPRLTNALASSATFNTNDQPEAFGMPLASTYLNNPQYISPPGLNDIASQSDLAEAQALAQLSGGNYNPSITGSGNYSIPNLPKVDQARLANELYGYLANLHPTFGSASNPNMALTGYNTATSNLWDYLGIPNAPGGSLPPPPPAPPPSNNQPGVPPPSGGGGHPGIMPFYPST